jgi:hypothetical protein
METRGLAIAIYGRAAISNANHARLLVNAKHGIHTITRFLNISSQRSTNCLPNDGAANQRFDRHHTPHLATYLLQPGLIAELSLHGLAPSLPIPASRFSSICISRWKRISSSISRCNLPRRIRESSRRQSCKTRYIAHDVTQLGATRAGPYSPPAAPESSRPAAPQ